MKIQPIKNYYNQFINYKNSDNKNIFTTYNQVQRYYSTNSILKNPLKETYCDIISFSAKPYSADSITNPTNHCAYCGCKVYDETEIDFIANEILTLKASKLEGKLKSVLEKLTQAMNSPELSAAKRTENKDEIDFFNNLKEASSKKAYLNGEGLFAQVYKLDAEEAHKRLVKNLHPLQKTIDHISPQNEKKNNNNSDINLVEACYCCNHNLKKGFSFAEFHSMYPSIKINMPKDKFQYALSQILDSPQSEIFRRLSAADMIKYVKGLFAQRTETQNVLNSINYRIQGCISGIKDSIYECKREIEKKKQEKRDLEAKFEELKQDPEYSAILQRNSLQTNLDNIKSALKEFKKRQSGLNKSIQDLENPSKKNKKTRKGKGTISEGEKTKKLEQLRTDLGIVSSNITEKENEKSDIEIQIEQLNEQYPTIEMLQESKSKTEAVISAYSALENERKQLEENNRRQEELEHEEAELKAQLSKLPKESENFNINSFSEEEKNHYNTYIYITDSSKKQPNTKAIKPKGYSSIAQEIQQLEQLPVIKAYKDFEERKVITAKLKKVQNSISDLTIEINKSREIINNTAKITETMSLEEAQAESEELTGHIKRLTTKQNQTKIPQRISSIEAEITLLKKTIQDLTIQLQKIEDSCSTT